jgi:hypothetical protein
MTMCGVVGKILGGGGTARSSQPSLARLPEALGGPSHERIAVTSQHTQLSHPYRRLKTCYTVTTV